ncbi:cysteine-rich receptor-like protein kinase 10 isoform X2 [Impatiens glandulifera]|nr:cysteine-rich receptor-like protein kinase 10 isoform X2 [Impatiens glandulifera]
MKEHDEEGLSLDTNYRRNVFNSEDLNRKASNERRQQQDSVYQDEHSLQFELNKLREATNNFSSENQIGKGGFGLVYKGKLPNGQEIAVKRLAQGSKQGEREFKNEITLMVKLHHRNLTKLLGFCLDGKERLLVYEFVPNKSLDHFIFDPIRRMLLNWETRYKIIVGVASGLLYLHEGSRLTIIHHDLKASNVLLDDKMNPRISDFGMSRLFMVDNSQHKTKRIVGTYGYIAPEFANYGQYSDKTDVFSFGVLILEIVSGKSNSSRERSGHVTEHLLSYVWKKWRKGKIKNLIDPTIIDGSLSEKMRCIHIGLLCVQEVVAKRPTMALVMLMLNSSTVSMAIPSKPGFLIDVSTEIRTIHSSINHVSITDPYPR